MNNLSKSTLFYKVHHNKWIMQTEKLPIEKVCQVSYTKLFYFNKK
jgi:hypothetical protein